MKHNRKTISKHKEIEQETREQRTAKHNVIQHNTTKNDEPLQKLTRSITTRQHYNTTPEQNRTIYNPTQYNRIEHIKVQQNTKQHLTSQQNTSKHPQ